MANPEHVKLLLQGVKSRNEWREAHPDTRPNLRGADLREANLHGVDLGGADLRGANLRAWRVESVVAWA